MRDAALRISQLDMADPEPPELTEEQVTQWVKNITYELGKARERGQHVPPGVAVYADPRMLEAANRIALQSLRLRLEDGTELYLAPPPPSYTLGTIEQEIERAAAEAQPTQELPAMDAAPKPELSACERYGCPQCFPEPSAEGPRTP
jgi:hypothetical protein